MKLFEAFTLKGIPVKNRVGVPPMVCFHWTGLDGRVTENSVRHYAELAKGGAGLIISEACCISPRGRVSDCSIGIWEDSQIEGLSRLVDSVHAEGTPILLQIQHSGLVGYGETQPLHNYLPESIKPYTAQHGDVIETKGPSEYSCVFPFDGLTRRAGEMTEQEIHAVQEEFVAACVRAWKAGADGVELHGCHFYLISQFMNTRVNRRTDTYGIHPEQFCVEIMERVRKAVPKEFIIGVRLGVFEPTLEDGIRNAKALERAGADFLHMSFGFAAESEPMKPDDYPFNEFIYGAQVIRRNVSVPVFAVNGISSPEQAEEILRKTNVDMCFVGTGHLVNENWTRDAESGKDVGRCLRCSYCQWRAYPDKCPGRIVLERKRKS
ncbi:MAG: oxidase [Oscillospiraceae bacterium]|nr:oxidase [Oscillospiraceae bacterium]